MARAVLKEAHFVSTSIEPVRKFWQLLTFSSLQETIYSTCKAKVWNSWTFFTFQEPTFPKKRSTTHMDFLIRWRIFCLLINKTSAKVTPPILCEILYRVFQKLNRATYLVLSINLYGIAFFYCMEINSWIKHTVISNLAQVMIMMFKTRQYFYKYLAFFFCLKFYMF